MRIMPHQADHLRVNQSLYVVAIGASAGGLEAMLTMFPHLVATRRIVYLIAQHMASDGHSDLLVRLLNRVSPLPVVLAEDGDMLQVDHIYMVPAGSDGRVRQGRIQLLPPVVGSFSVPSINVLFSSIAQEYSNHAVGIVLSGTRSDGVAGCRDIKAQGGIILAQEPNSAKFDGMPVAAIEAGVVDSVVLETQMIQELYRLLPGVFPSEATNAPLVQLDQEVTPEFLQLLRIVLNVTGGDFTQYKRSTLERRLDRRMLDLGIPTLQAYSDYLAKRPEEAAILHQAFLVSQSSFFRDRDAFYVLEKSLAALLQTKQEGDAITIWVAGCATGEEVYTYAILLSEILGARREHYDIRISGTDLNALALAKAQTGSYRQKDFKEMNSEYLARYFQVSDQNYQVDDALKKLCRFEQQDVLKTKPTIEFDLISCRNVLIYMKIDLQDQLIKLFHQCLSAKGLLFLGQSESINPLANAYFSAIDTRQKIYRKRLISV